MNSALLHPEAPNHDAPTVPADGASPHADLDALVRSITAIESLVAQWEPERILTVQALKSAIEALHKEALKRLIRALKDDPAAGSRLRESLADPVVYGVLRFHGLVKEPLNDRVQRALEEVRPALAAHGGNVELVAIKPPDTVDVRLVGSCHGCPASGQTLSEGIEKTIRAHCPEILHVHQVSRAPVETGPHESTIHFISPFAATANSGWVDAATLDEIPEGGILPRTIQGRSVLLAKRDHHVSCFDNACAHLGMPLDMAEIAGDVITCAYHGFQYRLDTGECLTAPEVQLKMHGVRRKGPQVQIRLED